MPRQLANRPRAHPPPPGLSRPRHAAGAGRPVLIPLSRGYPGEGGRLPTCYSAVRHSCPPEGGLPFDLHVLGAPPAFILSQDRTLRSGGGARAPPLSSLRVRPGSSRSRTRTHLESRGRATSGAPCWSSVLVCLSISTIAVSGSQGSPAPPVAAVSRSPPCGARK